MSSIAAKRIQKELMEVIRSDEAEQCGIKLELVNEDFSELKGEIMGPPDTPYEGGKFELQINITNHYPFRPPQLRFVTKIWHANISSVTGAICLDILQDKWVPSFTLRSVLLSLQLLLSSPEPDDPQDAVVALQFKENPEMFDLTARHWTQAYAGGSSQNQSFDDKIETLMNLGHTEMVSRTVLSTYNWDLELAERELSPNIVRNNNNNNNNDHNADV